MRLTDEELSRVLTAHEAGGLEAGEHDGVAYPACLVETARRVTDQCLKPGPLDVAHWFDGAYQPSWTTEEFLAALEAQELA